MYFNRGSTNKVNGKLRVIKRKESGTVMYNLTEERIGVDLNNKETEKEIQRERK